MFPLHLQRMIIAFLHWFFVYFYGGAECMSDGLKRYERAADGEHLSVRNRICRLPYSRCDDPHSEV